MPINLGAPGLAFETWEATNLHGRGTSPPSSDIRYYDHRILNLDTL